MFRKLSVTFLGILVLIWAVAIPAAPSASAGTLGVFSGTVAVAGEWDLYTVYITTGSPITATLVCDEIAPGNRPLDPVLHVFLPGADTSSLGNAFVSNDDGYTSMPCNAFWSSIVSFTAPATGNYTFLARGFGASTGPYTLTVTGNLLYGCEDFLPLTADSVVGTFVKDAQVYYEPGSASPDLVIEAGKSYWVLGKDASGMYYKVILQCQPLWVLADTVGPNYDDVWQGRPLPTGVVK